jgi:hypothetical protein
MSGRRSSSILSDSCRRRKPAPTTSVKPTSKTGNNSQGCSIKESKIDKIEPSELRDLAAACSGGVFVLSRAEEAREAHEQEVQIENSSQIFH